MICFSFCCHYKAFLVDNFQVVVVGLDGLYYYPNYCHSHPNFITKISKQKLPVNSPQNSAVAESDSYSAFFAVFATAASHSDCPVAANALYFRRRPHKH